MVKNHHFFIVALCRSFKFTFFHLAGMGSKIDKYKKNYPNMGGIVYFITGKKKYNLILFYLEKYNITGRNTDQTGIRKKENR